MSDGKKIPIEITTTSDNAGVEDVKKGLQEVEDGLQDVSHAGDDAADATKGMEENIGEISRAQKAQAVAQLAQAVGKIGERFRESAREVREFDRESADALDQMADRIDKVSTSASALAMGFAAGGPLGAAVTALGIGLTTVIDKYQEAEVAAIKSAASQRKAIADAAMATRDAAAEAERRADELASKEIEDAIRRQNDLLADGLKLLDKQLEAARKVRREKEEILTAEDELDLAEIDLNQASGKVTDVEAEKQRSEVAVRAKKRADEYKKQDAIAAAMLAEESAKLKDNAAAFFEVQAQRAAGLAEERKVLAEEAVRKADYAKKTKAILDAINAEQDARASFFTTAGQQQELNKNTQIAWEERNKIAPGDTRVSLVDKTASSAKDAADAAASAKLAANFAAQTKAAADAARKDADDAQARSLATQQESGSTVSTVEQRADIEARARDAREAAQRIRKDAEDGKKQQQEREKKQDDDQRRREQEAGIGSSALGLLPRGVRDDFARSVQKVAKGLQDGDQGGEIKELTALMDRLAAAVEIKGSKTQVTLKHLSERIKKLENK